MTNIREIKQPGYRDIVKTLRVIADEIEAGQHGQVYSGALVLESDATVPVCVFGMGQGELATAYTLLGLGQRFLERQMD